MSESWSQVRLWHQAPRGSFCFQPFAKHPLTLCLWPKTRPCMAGLDPRRPQGEVPSPQRRCWMDPSSTATPQGVSWAGGSSLAMVWKAPWMVLDTSVGSPPSAPSCSHSATGMNWEELGGKQGGGQSCRDTYWEVDMLAGRYFLKLSTYFWNKGSGSENE